MNTNSTLEKLLTSKQKAFCDEYLIDMNATRAALAVGYSIYTAMNGRLMQITKIKMYLKERTELKAQQAQVSQDMVLRELCKIAFGNLQNYFLPGGGLKPVDELTADEAAALWSVSVTDDGSGGKEVVGNTVKLRMYNKLTALDKIAKHLNFYKQEVKEAEPEYIYMSKEELTEEDYFEDDVDYRPGWEERHAVKVEQVRVEMESRMKESLKPEEGRLKEEEVSLEHKAESVKQAVGGLRQEKIVLVCDGGEPVCDGAGIPYGAVKKVFRFDLEESVEENLIRMQLYEAGDENKAESAASVARNRLPVDNDPHVAVQMELDVEFKKYSVIESRYKHLCVTEQMDLLERVKEMRVAQLVSR
jgi:hypothetical protein